MHYTLYYPEEGRCSTTLTLKEARRMKRQFLTAWIVDERTGEVVG